jgi:hypothetical protein
MEFNPIDKDKITETPHLLPYAHTVGGPVIKPEDKGKIRGRAMAAMQQQTDMQLRQIYRQIELLAQQAKEIQERVDISNRIYDAEIGFQPLVGHSYHLYEKNDGKNVLSIISPEEWGNHFPFASYIGEVRLLADHTWQVLS